MGGKPYKNKYIYIIENIDSIEYIEYIEIKLKI